jgi:hypothetical protein
MASAAEEARAQIKQAIERLDFAGAVSVLRANLASAQICKHGCYHLALWALNADADARRQAKAAGAVEVALAALQAHPAVAGVQRFGCSALAELLKDMVGEACAADAIEAATTASQAHAAADADAADADVQNAACCVFGVLGGSTVPPAVALNAVEALMAALRAHVTDAMLQGNGCRALAEFYFRNVHLRTAAIAAACISIATAALLAHAADPAVARGGCRMLADVIVQPASTSSLDALLAALRTHATVADVQGEGFRALCNMTTKCTDSQNAAVAAGALAMVHVGAQLADDSGFWREYVFHSITCLTSGNAATQAKAHHVGTVDVLVDALRAETQTVTVLADICDALGNVACFAAAAVTAGTLGAMETVIAVMKAHASDAYLQRHACFALRCMASGCATNMRKAHTAGAAELARAALRTHEADLVLCARASALLTLLQQSTQAADAAMAALVASEAAERAALLAVPPLKRKSKKKRRGGGGAARDASAERDAGALEAHEPAEPPAAGVAAGGDAPAPLALAAPTDADALGAAGGADEAQQGGGGAGGAGAGGAEAAPALAGDGGALPAGSQPAQPLLQPLLQPPVALTPAEGALLLPPYFAGLVLGVPPAPPAAAVPVAEEAAAAPAAAVPPPPPPPHLAALELGGGLQPAAAVAVAAAAPAAVAAAPALLAAAVVPPLPPPAVMKECCVCFLDLLLDDLFLLWPCAHRCVCEACADALMALPPPAERLCPMCRKPVVGASRVYDV